VLEFLLEGGAGHMGERLSDGVLMEGGPEWSRWFPHLRIDPEWRCRLPKQR
jgi:hypothetical protein